LNRLEGYKIFLDLAFLNLKLFFFAKAIFSGLGMKNQQPNQMATDA